MSTYLCQTLICYFSHIAYVCLHSYIDSESEELLNFSPPSGVYVYTVSPQLFSCLATEITK